MPVPSEHAPVPPAFDAWFARALQRDPDRRFQSARELAESLQDALAVTAGPGPTGARSNPAASFAQPATALELTAPASVAAAGSRPLRGMVLSLGFVVLLALGSAAMWSLRSSASDVAVTEPSVETATAPARTTLERAPQPPVAVASPAAEPVVDPAEAVEKRQPTVAPKPNLAPETKVPRRVAPSPTRPIDKPRSGSGGREATSLPKRDLGF